MRRWLLIITVVLVAVFGAGWWFLPSLVQIVALHYAPDLGVRGMVLDLEKIGTSQARAKRLHLTVDTSNGPITLKLKDVTARYDLVGLTVEELHAESGEAVWRQEFTTSAVDDAPIALPLLPASRFRVDHMQVSLLTPVLGLTVPGKLEAHTDPKRGIDLALQGGHEKITAHAPPDAASLAVRIADTAAIPVLQAEIGDPLGNHTKVDLRADLARLRAWLPHRLQTDKLMLDHLAAASVNRGQLNTRIVYDAKASNWTLPDIHLEWERLNVLDIISTAKIHAAATPDGTGWRLRVLDNSPFTLTGPGLPVGDAQLEFAPGATISIAADGAAQGRGPVALRAHSADKRLAGNVDEWRIASDGAAMLQLSKLTAEPYAITADKFIANTTNTDGDPLARGKVALLGLRMHNKKKDPQPAPYLDTDAAWHRQGNKINAAGKVSIDGKPIAHIQARSGPTTAMGSAEISLDTDASKVSGLLTGMHPWFSSLVVRTGKMRGDAKLNWTERGIKGAAKVRLSGLGADIMAAQLNDAEIKLSVADLSNAAYRFVINIPTFKPANAMELKSISVNGSWHNGVINVSAAELLALGGRLWMPPQQLDLRPDTKLVVRAEDLELSELFRLADVSGLSGSGKLKGEIPVLIYTGGIEVPNSSLTAVGPGKLSYISETGANKQLDNIALQALKDFRYDAMNASVIYKRNGDYSIKAHLKGSNPELYNGYPIAFNINLHGNLPGILRASLLTGNFDKEVLRQVQEDRKKTRSGGSTKPGANDVGPEHNVPKHPPPGVQ